jgi:RimJ/RimL family protein N-acetyltransferase
MLPAELRTDRLVLRRFRDDDRAPFAEMNADPRVMRHFPATLTRLESDATVERIRANFHARGFGLWAIEVPGQAEFIGFTGLMPPSFEAHFTPCIEVGWRLASGYWGNGFATEAARAAVRFGFEQLGLREIVSFTVPTNVRSLRVMQKLGMHHALADDFDHPRLPEGHALRRHVLYRLSQDAWLAREARREPP